MFESALPLINSAVNNLPVNPANSLQLRDIHLPEAVSWWPPAIGWWLTPLLVVLLALAFITLRRALHKRRQSAHKKIARAELQRIKQQYADSDDALHSLRELSVLLRRVALSYLPREHSASLTGEAWIAQLNQLAQHKVFNQQHLELLSRGVYQPQLEADLKPLLSLCEQWLQQLPTHAPARQRNER
jgi:flagellar biosynthesis/type III secretory pathway M-ring protein FliF/YscJ